MKLLQFRWLNTDDLIDVRYLSKFEAMWNDATINPLPDDYGKTVLWYLVAWTLAYETKLPIAERLLNIAYANLQNMYQDFTNTTNVVKQGIKPKPYKFNSVR